MAAKAEKTEPVETKSYKVLSNLRHGGKFYAPGQIVDLSAEDAKSLKALKVIKEDK